MLSLPEETEDLCKIIDEAGSFLIHVNEYADGLELFRLAAPRFLNIAEFQQGIGCCAGHEGFTITFEVSHRPDRAFENGCSQASFRSLVRAIQRGH